MTDHRLKKFEIARRDEKSRLLDRSGFGFRHGVVRSSGILTRPIGACASEARSVQVVVKIRTSEHASGTAEVIAPLISIYCVQEVSPQTLSCRSRRVWG